MAHGHGRCHFENTPPSPGPLSLPFSPSPLHLCQASSRHGLTRRRFLQTASARSRHARFLALAAEIKRPVAARQAASCAVPSSPAEQTGSKQLLADIAALRAPDAISNERRGRRASSAAAGPSTLRAGFGPCCLETSSAPACSDALWWSLCTFRCTSGRRRLAESTPGTTTTRISDLRSIRLVLICPAGRLAAAPVFLPLSNPGLPTANPVLQPGDRGAKPSLFEPPLPTRWLRLEQQPRATAFPSAATGPCAGRPLRAWPTVAGRALKLTRST